MKRLDKAKRIGSILDKLYPKTPIPLDHNSSYTLIVAVMLSAQTTDKKVNQVTPKLFKHANTPQAMANLELDKIQDMIKEIGLAPTKAKNLKKMANQLIDAGGKSDYFEAGIEPLLQKVDVFYSDVSDLPCLEIDFLEDLNEARGLF